MDAIWQEISDGVTKVFSIDTSAHVGQSGAKTTVFITKQDYIRLYTIIYDSCHKQVAVGPAVPNGNSNKTDPAKYIYEHLQTFINEYITNLAAETQIQNSDIGLQKFNQLWTNYNISSIITSNLFNYINRIWVKSMSEKAGCILEIHHLTQVVWITHIIDPRIGQLDNILNTLIDTERDGEVINTRLISNFIGSLLALGCETDVFCEHKGSLCIYRKYFETNYLANTKEYYRRRATELIQQTDITGYMQVIADWISAENHRVNSYLHDISRAPVNTILEDTLIREFAQQMVAELPRYFTSGMTNEIGVLYSLMKRIDNVQLMADMFGEFTTANGLAAISSLPDDDPDKFMTAVLGVYADSYQILREHFKCDQLFVAAFDKAHRTFINTNVITTTSTKNKRPPGIIAQILGKYTDSVLRGSTKPSSVSTAATTTSLATSETGREDDVEIHIENIISIFKYLEDKDIYQKFYSKYLAKRLISGKIISEDAENSMISKLKSLCGTEFTSRFQTMTKDLVASRELTAKYKSSPIGKSSSAAGFDILVLTSGSWPIQATAAMGELILPAELQKFNDAFTTFYMANSQGRKLTWLHNLAYGDLTTNYIKGSDGKRMKYVFQASGIQMVILLAFNQQETLTITDLAHTTGIKPDNLTSQMELLVKMKILKQKTSEESQPPAYTLNNKYSYKKIKVNINQPIKSEIAAETSDLVKGAEEDRTYSIQATIVRIMKSRNVLSHALLVGETITQCSKYFTPKVPTIKKNIDSLIEKEYLKRSEGKRDEYTYVA
jgi:cullin 1